MTTVEQLNEIPEDAQDMHDAMKITFQVLRDIREKYEIDPTQFYMSLMLSLGANCVVFGGLEPDEVISALTDALNSIPKELTENVQ